MLQPPQCWYAGLIVLPCGAGKSLVGITAAARIKKSVLVLVTNNVSVDQWRYQFQLWTNLQGHQIARQAPAPSAACCACCQRTGYAWTTASADMQQQHYMQQQHHMLRVWLRFTSDIHNKEMFAGASGVLVTTYSMIAFSGKRSEESNKVMEAIQSREWGLLLLDEVHVVPAQMFRKVRPVPMLCMCRRPMALCSLAALQLFW